MIRDQKILLVSPPGGSTNGLVTTLVSAGYAVDVADNFTTGKEILGTRPDLLISELKLGTYNGLHLAIRAGVQGTSAIVVGERDAVQEAEANRHATYLAAPVDGDELLLVVKRLLAEAGTKRRSTRKHVPPLDAFVDDMPARLLDVSYEGLRLESCERDALPELFRLRLPLFNFSCPAQRVWTGPGVDAAANGVACGAVLSIADADTLLAWRTLVDTLPGLALTV